MTKICKLCGKSRFKVVRRIKTRSKYNPVSTYFQKPNIQWFTLKNGKRIKICTKCRKRLIKSGSINV